MNKERGLESKEPTHHVSYLLPDGLSCEWIYIPDELPTHDLEQIADSAVRLSHNVSTEVRITQNSGINIESTASYLSEHYQNEVSFGKTTYFEVPLSTPKPELPSLDNYLVYPLSQATEDTPIVKSLMLESFPLAKEKIERNFDAVIGSPGNDIYLIRDSKENLIVGTFLLKYIPSLREVQLHAVAGRSVDPRVSQERNKLPIIMSGVMEAVSLQYPSRITYGITAKDSLDGGVDTLTFSASRVAHLYQNLGFATSSRNGLVIHPIQSKDNSE